MMATSLVSCLRLDLGEDRLRRLRHRYARPQNRRWHITRTVHSSFVVHAVEQMLHNRRSRPPLAT